MAEFEKQDAAKLTDSSIKEVQSAWHVAAQDASVDQITKGENWNLPDDYAVSKVIQKTDEFDKENGDGGSAK